MAEENETSPLIFPEQRVARLLATRMRLEPPVDIEDLTRKYAVVEEDELPQDSDAVVITRAGEKPVIVLNRKKPATRRRFTLAHELGHILIPWHVGTVACHTDWIVEFHDNAYAQTESEANRFASELLMPRDWLLQLVRPGKGLRRAFSAVRRTDVSPHAASVALVQVLGPGYVFAVVDRAGKVSLSGASPATSAKRPVRGQPFDKDDYDTLSSRHAQIEDVYWWYFDPKSPPATPKDPRAASLILREMLQALGIRGARAEKLTLSINGIIGSANRAMRAGSIRELFAGLRQRFLSRPELRNVISHEDFDAFLLRRAEEIRRRRAPAKAYTPRGKKR